MLEVALGGPWRGRPGSVGGGGGERRPRPSLCSRGVATCSPSSPPPNSSGREGVNLPASQQECGAINTHSLAVCQSGSQSEGAGSRDGGRELQSRQRQSPAGTPGPRTLLGDSVGTEPASPGPHPPSASGPDPPSWRPPAPPTSGEQTFLGKPLSCRAGWTGRSRRLDRQTNRRSGHLSLSPQSRL